MDEKLEVELQRLPLYSFGVSREETPTTEEEMLMNSYWEVDQRRIQKAQKTAQHLEQELLTPAAVSELFEISASTVRAAKHRGRINPRFKLALHRDVSLYLLREAVAVWGEPKDMAKLERMRREGHTLGVGQTVFVVLNPWPLLSLSDPDELEGGS